MTDLKALLALLLLSCSAAGRSLRTRSSSIGEAKFWSVGGSAAEQSASSFQLPMMTTTLNMMFTTTTAVPTVTSIGPGGAVTGIPISTTTYNAAMAAMAASNAQAAAAREKALEAREEAEKAEAEAKKDEADAAKKAAEAAASANTPKPEPATPPPPPPSPAAYGDAFNAVIANAATQLSDTIKTAVTQAFETHGPAAMNTAVALYREKEGDMPPFCDELTTPPPIQTMTELPATAAPRTEPPVVDANEMGAPATTTEAPTPAPTNTTAPPAPQPTVFPYRLYAGDAYCVMRNTGVPTTTLVDLGGQEAGAPEKVFDASDFEFLRMKGKADPGQPVRVLAHAESKAAPAKVEENMEAAKNKDPKKDQASAPQESAECHMRRTECNDICKSDNSTVKNFDCKPATKEAQYNCICGNSKLVVSSDSWGKGNQKQKEATPSEKGKQKPKPLSPPPPPPVTKEQSLKNVEKRVEDTTSKAEMPKGKHVDEFLKNVEKRLEDKKIEVLPKAEATAIGEAAEGALQKMVTDLPTVDGSEPYPISGPPPGMDMTL